MQLEVANFKTLLNINDIGKLILITNLYIETYSF